MPGLSWYRSSCAGRLGTSWQDTPVFTTSWLGDFWPRLEDEGSTSVFGRASATALSCGRQSPRCGQATLRLRNDCLANRSAILILLLASTAAPTNHPNRSLPS